MAVENYVKNKRRKQSSWGDDGMRGGQGGSFLSEPTVAPKWHVDRVLSLPLGQPLSFPLSF